MEIRVLRYFLTVAREGSITRAANFLHLTQPTLSRQLKDLEKELGQKLLIRGNHSVSLTPEGMVLRQRAEEIIEMVEKTESEFSSIKDTIAGDIYIGSGETDSMTYIAEVIKEIKSEFPKIKYHLQSGNAEDITERIDKGLLDFGILIQPVDLSKYNYITMPAKDVWGILMRKDSDFAQKNSVNIDDLLSMPLISSRQVMRKNSSENNLKNWFGDRFEELNIVATYNLVYNAAVLVRSGIGFALTLDKLVNTTSVSDLCFKPLNPRLESNLYIVWKKSQVFSPAAKLFLAKIKEKFE